MLILLTHSLKAALDKTKDNLDVRQQSLNVFAKQVIVIAVFVTFSWFGAQLTVVCVCACVCC